MATVYEILHLTVSVRLHWELDLSEVPLFQGRGTPTRSVWWRVPYRRIRPKFFPDSNKRATEFWQLFNKFVQSIGDDPTAFKLADLALADKEKGTEIKASTTEAEEEGGKKKRYAYYSSHRLAQETRPKAVKFSSWIQPKYEVRMVTDKLDNNADFQQINDLILERNCNDNVADDYCMRNFFATLVAAQRSVLFLPSIAVRHHHLFFPPARLTKKWPKSRNSDTSQQQQNNQVYVLIPYLTFYRGPDLAKVKRNFSFSMFFVPIGDEPQKGPVEITSSQAAELIKDFSPSSTVTFDHRSRYKLEGDFGQLLGLSGGEERDLYYWVRKSLECLPMFTSPQKPKNKSLVDSILSNSLATSAIWTAVLLPDWLHSRDMKNWAGNNYSKQAKQIDDLVEQFIKGPFCGMDKVDQGFRSACVDYGPKGDVIFHGHSYRSTVSLSLIPRESERFPRYSALWRITWLAVMGNAISLARTMIQSFHNELSKEDDLKTFLIISREFVSDFADVYDLNILSPGYKRVYGCIKAQDGIDRDYQKLKDEVQALSEQIRAKYQRNVQRWIWILTGVLVLATLALVFFTWFFHL